MNRRRTLALLGASAVLAPLARAAEKSGVAIATNTYPWLTFARRAQEPFTLHADELLADIAASGITGYEPIIESPEELAGLGERLRAHGLEMRSLYVNSTLHEETAIDASVARVRAIGEAAKPLGVDIIVTNPAPIRWGGTEDKDDAQLRRQAEALNRLGAALREGGIALAYHNHDAELRQGGREFHHMLTATDPANVKFCLDAHWVFRGCGDSEVAVFDALAHYGDRIVELHLRQSVGSTWSEAFAMTGDIDYGRLIAGCARGGAMPHLVLEQAVEEKSPQTQSAVQAHALGRTNLARGLAS